MTGAPARARLLLAVELVVGVGVAGLVGVPAGAVVARRLRGRLLLGAGLLLGARLVPAVGALLLPRLLVGGRLPARRLLAGAGLVPVGDMRALGLGLRAFRARHS